MESVSCKKKREIVYSWTKPVRFAIAGGARVKKDGLYKSLNYQLYIEKRKPPLPPTILVVNVKLQLIGL